MKESGYMRSGFRKLAIIGGVLAFWMLPLTVLGANELTPTVKITTVLPHDTTADSDKAYMASSETAIVTSGFGLDITDAPTAREECILSGPNNEWTLSPANGAVKLLSTTDATTTMSVSNGAYGEYNLHVKVTWLEEAEDGKVPPESPRGVITCEDVLIITVLKVLIPEIHFNWDSSDSSQDSVTLEENLGSSKIAAPEWRTATINNKPACYIRNITPKVKAKIRVQPNSVTSVKIRAVGANGMLPKLNEKSVNFINGESGLEEFTMSAALPNMVTNILDKWEWKLRDVNSSGSAECDVAKTGQHKVFVILAAPIDPMLEDEWVELLDIVCSVPWAGGATSGDDALSSIVSNIYYSGMFYNPEPAAYTKEPSQFSSHTFDLERFIPDLLNGTARPNCMDASDAAIVFTKSLGVEYEWRRKEKFTCNYYDSLGVLYPQDPPASSRDWIRDYNSFHQFIDKNSRIWDPTYALDGDADTTSKPCTHLVPVNMPLTAYHSKLVNLNDDWDNPFPQGWNTGGVGTIGSVP